MQNPLRHYRAGPRVVRARRTLTAKTAKDVRRGHASTAEHLKWVLPFLRAKWGGKPPLGSSRDEPFEQRNALAPWAV
jgi:hypothetical protein